MFLIQICFVFFALFQTIFCNKPKEKMSPEAFEQMLKKSQEIFANFAMPMASSQDPTLEKTVETLTEFNKDIQNLVKNITEEYDLTSNNFIQNIRSRSGINALEKNLEAQQEQTKQYTGEIFQEYYHNDQILKSLVKNIEDEATYNATQELERNIILSANDRSLYTDADVKDAKDKGQQIQGYMSTCLNAFLKNIPPSFCYKKGADAGRIPNNCPVNFQKILALCYQNCNPGYYHWGGICWQSCGSYRDIGLICTKGIFNWFWKKSYVPYSLTFFDKNVGCNSGEYKMGALCYRDCNKNGMVNCGIGACALSGAACAKGILEMVFDFLCGLGEFILFVVSFGASGPATQSANSLKAAKQSLGQAVKQAGKAAMDAAFKTVKTWITNFSKENLKKFITKKAKEILLEKIIDTIVDKACAAIGDYVWDEIGSKNQPNLDMDEKEESFADKIPIWGQCSKVDSSNGSPNDEIACAKDVLNTVGMVDPTGIVAMAAAFLQPICDV